MRRLILCFVSTGAAVCLAAPPPLPLTEVVDVNGMAVSTQSPPAGLVTKEDLGLVAVAALGGQVVHRTQTRILETRATITPKGDYLLMFPEGDHYAKSKGERMNQMMACRSTDKGKTWSAPVVAYDIPYSQHGFIPLIPRGTKRIYAFGTQPMAGHWTHEDGQRENAAIGYRWSDDDGHTWSKVKLIAPVNDPEFRGMSVMRMTETAAGTWLLGSHTADWSVKPIETKQYLLRSEDRGESWTLLPKARPDGWSAQGFHRMDEGRPLDLGGGRVLFMTRTPQGHLFTAWSEDDGKSWTEPAPSSLVHPDAPPMLFPLSDGKTLVAFHHNRVPPTNPSDLNDHAETMKVRSALWVATSTDQGRTWSEPRFVLANAIEPAHKVSGFNHQCSYLDLFIEDGVMHMFLPHRWQQVLHLTLPESALGTFPTAADLRKITQPVKKSADASAKPATVPKQPVYTSGIAAKLHPTRQVVYKEVGGQQLRLHIFEPHGFQAGDKRPCFISIHGGGWMGGSPGTMYPFTAHCAGMGMVGISVQYRLYKPGTDVAVADCVRDARSAARYVRAHAKEFGIDPNKIVVNGASAGGHLAAATAMFDGLDNAGDDLSFSCQPQALVLFSPVIDTSEEGYGHAKVGAQWKELSPAHQVRKGLPPTLLFHGTEDTTTPFKGAQKFHEAMIAAGNICEMEIATGTGHTFMFKEPSRYEATLQRLDDFLAKQGFLPKEAE